MRKNLIVASLLLLAAAPPAQEKETARFAVVINANNKCTETGDQAKELVKKLFLKQLTKWPQGEEAKPYSRKSDNDAQAAFVKTILGMSDAELARHWLKVKNQNGTTPPKEVTSDRMLLKYVAKHEGAFAIVELKELEEGDKDVKVLFKF